MRDTKVKQQPKPDAAKPVPKEKIEREQQPRELAPEEIKAVAGGPFIRNGA